LKTVVVFLRINAPNFGVFRFALSYAKTRDRGSIFAFDSVLVAYSLAFSGSRLQFLGLFTVTVLLRGKDDVTLT